MSTTRLTYRQLGERLGITPDAARMKAKREAKKPGATWRLIPGNHPSDPVHVELPEAELPDAPPERSPPSDPTPPTVEPLPLPTVDLAPIAAELAGARQEIARVTGLLIEETRAHGDTRASLAEAQARAGLLERETIDQADAIGRLSDALRSERNKTLWQRIFG